VKTIKEIIDCLLQAQADAAGERLDYDSWLILDEAIDQAIPTLRQSISIVVTQDREKVAQWIMAKGYATGHGDIIEEMLEELYRQVREREREACAKLCENSDRYRGKYFAEAIRARR
jgi:hypothetical protein